MTPSEQWPGDSATVTRWVRASLRPVESDLEIRGLDDVRVSAEVRGHDLDNLTIDASGVKLRLRAPKRTDSSSATATAPPPAPAGAPPLDSPASEVPLPEIPTPEVVSRTTGIARTLRLRASPVRVQGIPVTVEAQLHDAPIEWQTYAEPVTAGRPESRYGIDIAGDGYGDGTKGSFRASMRSGDLTRLLTAVLRPTLKAGGVRLRRITATVVPDSGATGTSGAEDAVPENATVADGPTDGIRIEVKAGIRWRLIGASARGVARIGVHPDGVITVRDLQVGSFNPFVALALRAARKTIRAQIGRTYDLNEMAGADGSGPRVHDVRVTAGDDLTLAARLG